MKRFGDEVRERLAASGRSQRIGSSKSNSSIARRWRMSGSEESDAVREELLGQIGKPMGAGGPAVAPDEVNLPMIRHWVDALDDRNPIYLDEAAARQNGFEGLVAPPAMLQTWTMGRPTIKGIAERGGTASEVKGENPITMLADAGYTGTLATNSELEFDRYLRPGDLLRSEGLLESISERKTTGIGSGYFVTWVTTYTDETGAEVGRQRFRVYKFAPGMGGGASGEKKKAAPKSGGDVSPSGEELPGFDLNVTSTVIVAGAIASRDFMPVHHDPEFARAQGAPDMFMNILTTNGYVARYVTDWAGPSARLRRVAIRLGAPAVPGKLLRFSGRVSKESVEGGRRVLSVDLAAVNDFGPHATGTVELTLPQA
jgi:acyl dehydratase